MARYETILYVNGQRTIVVTSGETQLGAQKIAVAMFNGAKVSIFSTRKVS